MQMIKDSKNYYEFRMCCGLVKEFKIGLYPSWKYCEDGKFPQNNNELIYGLKKPG